MLQLYLLKKKNVTIVHPPIATFPLTSVCLQGPFSISTALPIYLLVYLSMMHIIFLSGLTTPPCFHYVKFLAFSFGGVNT